jgi:cell division protein FtsI/penicillin-binding protein 2
LIKTFTAFAYYSDQGKTFPTFSCPATLASDPNGCWDRNGHGRIGIVEAIGYSCNVYFTQLAKQTNPKTFQKVLDTFDFGTAANSDIHSVMVGKSLEWTLSPMIMLRAYSALFNGGYLYPYEKLPAKHIVLEEPLKRIIHQGMMFSTEKGTSTEAKKQSGQTMLSKTGTSYLWEDGKVNWRETQGWWIGLYPAEKPKIAVLTFVRRGRGSAHAAPLGGKVLAWYLQNQ